jgi:hypothetical protein
LNAFTLLNRASSRKHEDPKGLDRAYQEDPDRQNLFALRMDLIRAMDPQESTSTEFHAALLDSVQRAVADRR